MYGEQKGLVFTNEKCIGCNKCISVCPVITANRAIKAEDGSQRIEVDGEKCIACAAALGGRKNIGAVGAGICSELSKRVPTDSRRLKEAGRKPDYQRQLRRGHHDMGLHQVYYGT